MPSSDPSHPPLAAPRPDPGQAGGGASQPHPGAPAEERGRRQGAPRRFLVLDNSIVTQRIIARALERDGHASVLVGTGADALTVLRESVDAIDHVLVDLRLRDLDALEFIREVRALAGERTRITALSAALVGSDAEDRDRRRSLDAGADGLLLKPLRVRDLEALVRGGVAGSDA